MASNDPVDPYIELLKECLLGRIYGPELLHLLAALTIARMRIGTPPAPYVRLDQVAGNSVADRAFDAVVHVVQAHAPGSSGVSGSVM